MVKDGTSGGPPFSEVPQPLIGRILSLIEFKKKWHVDPKRFVPPALGHEIVARPPGIGDYNYGDYSHVRIFFYSKDNLVALHFKYDLWHRTATAGSDGVQSGRPIFDDFFQHLWPYIGNNTANVVFQMVKRLWLIRIDQ
ncbi:adhesion G protein-coupled receptor B2 [Trichonephila clavipes]|nr:adhesion G protein-coupled receptor B2 [Trichonephila clavipes]